MIKPMLAKDFELKRLRFPCWSQPKLDGLRCIATRHGLWSRLGNQFRSVPHIEKELASVFERRPNLVLDGELYTHDHRDDFPALCSLVKRTVITDEVVERSRVVQFWAFDVVNVTEPFSVRIKDLMSHAELFAMGALRYVTTLPIYSIDDLERESDRLLAEGFEGQMIRFDKPYANQRTDALLKRKPTESEVCLIEDIIEGEGKWLGMAGAFVCRHPNGEQFCAALADSDEKRREYWLDRSALIGNHAEVIYQKLLPTGVPRHPRLKSIIHSTEAL